MELNGNETVETVGKSRSVATEKTTTFVCSRCGATVTLPRTPVDRHTIESWCKSCWKAGAGSLAEAVVISPPLRQMTMFGETKTEKLGNDREARELFRCMNPGAAECERKERDK